MNSHLFYGYAALLFGLGLMEVSTVIVREVRSVACASYTAGAGMIYDHSNSLIFIDTTYEHYDQLWKRTLNPTDDDPWGIDLDTVGYAHTGPDALQSQGLRVYSLERMRSYKDCGKADDTLTIHYDNEEVKIVFASHIGCKNYANFLYREGVPLEIED